MRQSMVGLVLGAVVMARVSGTSALKAEKPGWHPLFDGATLTGWKAGEHPDAWTVKEGTLACNGERSHLFYVGPLADAQFADFEAEFEVRTHTGANSGVYFHTAWQDSGWPVQGFEMQVNNHQPHFPGDGGATYIENKKTGSLYGIRNAYKALARDNEWFMLKLRVQGPRVRIHVNDTLVVDYLEPEGAVAGLTPPLQKIGKGTFALQCHDVRSQVQYRRIAVHPLPPAATQTARAPTPDPASARRYRLARDNFPLVDLRALDLKDASALDAALAKARSGDGLFVGLSASAGKGGAVADDAGVDRLVRQFGGKPLFLGLRADWRDWAVAISPKALANVDYVLLDGQTISTRIERKHVSGMDSPEGFTDVIVGVTVTAMDEEPVDVYGAPTFRHPGGAGLFTDVHQQRLIEAAVRNTVAIEINGRLKLPSEAFVRKAKAAGAKFTFGECTLGTPAADYCFGIQEAVGLSWRDMYQPGHQPTRGAR
jgi:Domain of Unknown Function (DUF1080)